MIFWIFQTGEPLPSDKIKPRKMRAYNLADTLIKKGHKVVIWSSAFNHQDKIQRSKKIREIIVKKNLIIRLIPSPGYKKNISFGRLWDHYLLGRNLKRVLSKQTEKPDVAFVGFPPIEFAYEAAEWLKKNKLPFMLDVKDQWPDIFISRVPKIFKPFIELGLTNYFSKSKALMREADAISTISDSFLNWIYHYSSRKPKPNDIVATLSPIRNDDISSRESFEKKLKQTQIQDLKHRFVILFVGSLSKSFEFKPLLSAIEKSSERNLDWTFVICGEGELRDVFINFQKSFKNLILPGSIEEPEYKAIANVSDIAIAPYVKSSDFQISIPNKILDYMSFALPILTSLDGDAGKILVEQNIGTVYDPDIPLDMYKKLENFYGDRVSRREMSRNAVDKFQSVYQGEKVYTKLAETLESLSGKTKK